MDSFEKWLACYCCKDIIPEGELKDISLNCENEKNWDRDCIWSYIKRYPELVDKYKKIVYCSLDELKRIRYKYKIERKFKNLWEKIK